jgi:tRNA threonylcarbamoyladenosine biosynthesis protein TsaB
MTLMGWQMDDIDLFACSKGPGSFTAGRIGAATIKGLAFGSEKPCIGVSNLEALAYHLKDLSGTEDAILCPVMNARRGQVYNALFRVHDGVMTRLCEDRALAISALEQELSAYDLPIFLSGDGYEITKQGMTQLAVSDTPELLRYQNAYSVAMVALNAYQRGERTSDAELAPTYLRLPQAGRERNERLAREALQNK